MERVVVAVVLALVAVGVAAVIQRRQRPDAPAGRTYAVPLQVDRADFESPEVPWLVAVFTSATCTVCAGVWERARPLESAQVAVVEIEYSTARGVHDRYGIDAVPTSLVIDPDGVVMASWVGPVTATDLWAAVAEAREPGSTPDACH
ncbi:MAG: hypothetical protein WD691_08460 [Acidimicrobiales bacterium]